MKRVKNVKDTIYLLIFCEPRYAFEISKILYGRENKAVFAEIKQLVNDNWIEEASVPFVEKDEKGDKRAGQRKYYNAKIDPIISYIEKITNMMLDENDLSPLRRIIDSRPFRYLVEKNIPENFKEIPIDSIDFILTCLDVLFIISNRTKMFKKLQPGPRDIEDNYGKIVKSLKNNKIFIEKTPKLLEFLYEQTDVPDPVKENLAYLFIIPRRLAFNPPGFSDFGRKFYSIDTLSNEISKIMEVWSIIESTDNDKDKIILDSIDKRLETIEKKLKLLPDKRETERYFSSNLLYSFALVMFAVTIPLIIQFLDYSRELLGFIIIIYIFFCFVFFSLARKFLPKQKK